MLLGLLLLPLVLAVGAGWWNPLAAWEEGHVQNALVALSEPLDGSFLVGNPGLTLPLLIAAAFAVAFLVHLGRQGWSGARRLAVGIDIGVSSLGILGAAGALAVGAACDRVLFWAGAALLLAARPAPGVGGRPGGGWHAPTRLVWGLGLAILAGLTVLEGPAAPSPAFRLRDLWLGGPGRDPVASATAWAAWGALGGALALVRPGRGRRGVAVLLGASGAILAWWSGRVEDPLGWTGASSGLASLPWAALLACWPRRTLSVDPRRLLGMLVPWTLWAGICAARAFLTFMWTVPGPPPPGIEWLDWRPGAFSVGSDPDGQRVIWTDRESTGLGLWSGEGTTKRIDLRPQLDTAEELIDPGGESMWIAGARWAPTTQTGLVAWDPDRGPGAFVGVPGCWISSWVRVPDGAPPGAVAEPGDLLLGCEGSGELRVWRPKEGRVVGRLPLPDDMEDGVFSQDGSRLFTVSLWAGSDVISHAWPTLGELERRRVGPFNWGIVRDQVGTLWVSRFWEGGLLVLDPANLQVIDQVPLSFGIRALLHDPVHNRLWAAAAYTGRLWEIDASDPSRRRAHALCGQARDLVADRRGRVTVGTDCWIFRLDPSVLGPLP